MSQLRELDYTISGYNHDFEEKIEKKGSPALILRRSIFLELAVVASQTVFLTALEFVTLLSMRHVTVSLFPLRYRYCMLFVSCLVYTSITLMKLLNQIPITFMKELPTVCI